MDIDTLVIKDSNLIACVKGLLIAFYKDKEIVRELFYLQPTKAFKAQIDNEYQKKGLKIELNCPNLIMHFCLLFQL